MEHLPLGHDTSGTDTPLAADRRPASFDRRAALGHLQLVAAGVKPSSFIGVVSARGQMVDGKYKLVDWCDSYDTADTTGLERLSDFAQEAVAAGRDVFLLPHGRAREARTDDSGSDEGRLVWADLDDNKRSDAFDLILDLGGRVVRSGTADHGHVYLLLDRLITLPEVQDLNRDLRDIFGGDHKWAGNALLRLAGTRNFKSGPGVDSRPVEFVGERPATPIAPTELRAALAKLRPTKVLKVPAKVRKLLAEQPEVGARSEHFHRLVSACRSSGFTAEQVAEVVRPWCSRVELYDGRVDAEVQRSYDKVEATVEVEQPEKASASTRLVRLARTRYGFGISTTGDPFAFSTQTPHIVYRLRGAPQLKSDLAAAYFDEYGTAVGAQAISDAILVLESDARRQPPATLHMRVADTQGELWLDLGNAAGEVVRVTPSGWTVEAAAPVKFLRTRLTGELPVPVAEGAIDDLWPMLNVSAECRPVLAAYLVAALFDIPHPVLAMVSEQGSGKTTAMKFLSLLLDPSEAPVRKAPRDAETWVVAAQGSYVVALDNVSGMTEWLSDSLCRAVTGDGDVRRALFTDSELSVFSFRRVVMLNGIDLGDVRDDLADRLVRVDLEPLSEDRRLLDRDLQRAWAGVHPKALGGVLTLASQVQQALPHVSLDRLPRMADFARILAAVDEVLGTTGLKTFLGLRDHLAAETVAGDIVLGAMVHEVTAAWEGSAAELLGKIRPYNDMITRRREWPKDARQMSAFLRRRAPSLRRVGWTVDDLGRGGKGRLLRWRLVPPLDAATAGEANGQG